MLAGCDQAKRGNPEAKSEPVENPHEEVIEKSEIVEVEIGNGVKMQLCRVPAGTATLGSPKTERFHSKEEDEHEFVTRGFWLGRFEVTQAEWIAVMGRNPSRFVPEYPEIKAAGISDTARFPVDSVSQVDCYAFLKKLNESAKVPMAMGKGTFALPHGDEWEYACRGGIGNEKPFIFGNELNGDKANCNGQQPYGTASIGPALQRTTEAGSYVKVAPHPWGLYDMHGNVWEWCSNEFIIRGPYVIRGGAFGAQAGYCRSANIGFYSPRVGLHTFGMRVMFRPE